MIVCKDLAWLSYSDTMRYATFILFMVPCIIYGQSRIDHWCLGDSIHIKWEDSNFVYQGQVPFISKEGSASISDKEGNLLYYTDGRTVWGSDHQVIAGGTGLCDSLFHPFGSSVPQAAMFLPGFDSLERTHYVFTRESSIGPQGKVLYSTIRKDSISTTSSISEAEKLQVVFDTIYSESMTAVRHANGRDWWILVSHDEYGKKYIKHRLLSEGFVSEVNSFYFDSSLFRPHKKLIASYDGSMLGLAGSTFVYTFSFDRCTGQVRLKHVIADENDGYGAYGIEFSSNSEYIYVAESLSKSVWRFSAITGLIVDTIPTPKGAYPFLYGQLQRGPDKSIYLAYRNAGFPFTLHPKAQYLGRIPYPDSPGVAAGFDTLAVWLGGRHSTATLPNHPHYELGALEGSPCDTLSPQPPDTTSSIGDGYLESQQEWSLYPNPVSSTLMVEHPIGSKLVLQDLQGRTIRRLALIASPTAISVEGIPDGLYLAVLQDRNGKMLQRSRVLVRH